MLSVRPPRPIEVKKLIANLRLAWVSLGKIPSYHSWQVLSLMRSFSFTSPRVLESSCAANMPESAVCCSPRRILCQAIDCSTLIEATHG